MDDDINNKLPPVLIEEIAELAKKNGIKKVVLFGSRARGDNRRTSDIDLAVWGGDAVNFKFDVEEKTSTLLMFDVVDMSEAKSELLQSKIASEGIKIYAEI